MMTANLAPSGTPATSATSTHLRVVIVDDEELARDRIHALLAGRDDVTIVGECADGASAVETIDRERPDLVFLDVQMPGMDGFDVLQHIDSARVPAVVFVTAHDGHAIRAFDIHALDFLLKPFDQPRFETALTRARQQIEQRRGAPVDPQLASLIEELRSERTHPQRLVIKSGGRVHFLRTDEVDWVEASGNYVKIHTNGDAHLLRESMKNMEQRLDPRTFVRIHRSSIVNIDRIKELEPWFHGEYVVIMRDGTRLTASRVFSDRLTALVG